MTIHNIPNSCFTSNPLNWGTVIDKYYFYAQEPFAININTWLRQHKQAQQMLYQRSIVQNNDIAQAQYLYLVTSFNEKYHNYTNHYTTLYLNGVLISEFSDQELRNGNYLRLIKIDNFFVDSQPIRLDIQPQKIENAD